MVVLLRLPGRCSVALVNSLGAEVVVELLLVESEQLLVPVVVLLAVALDYLPQLLLVVPGFELLDTLLLALVIISCGLLPVDLVSTVVY